MAETCIARCQLRLDMPLPSPTPRCLVRTEGGGGGGGVRGTWSGGLWRRHDQFCAIVVRFKLFDFMTPKYVTINNERTHGCLNKHLYYFIGRYPSPSNRFSAKSSPLQPLGFGTINNSLIECRKLSRQRESLYGISYQWLCIVCVHYMSRCIWGCVGRLLKLPSMVLRTTFNRASFISRPLVPDSTPSSPCPPSPFPLCRVTPGFPTKIPLNAREGAVYLRVARPRVVPAAVVPQGAAQEDHQEAARELVLPPCGRQAS